MPGYNAQGSAFKLPLHWRKLKIWQLLTSYTTWKKKTIFYWKYSFLNTVSELFGYNWQLWKPFMTKLYSRWEYLRRITQVNNPVYGRIDEKRWGAFFLAFLSQGILWQQSWRRYVRRNKWTVHRTLRPISCDPWIWNHGFWFVRKKAHWDSNLLPLKVNVRLEGGSIHKGSHLK